MSDAGKLGMASLVKPVTWETRFLEAPLARIALKMAGPTDPSESRIVSRRLCVIAFCSNRLTTRVAVTNVTKHLPKAKKKTMWPKNWPPGSSP
jgi:hypothetical protein